MRVDLFRRTRGIVMGWQHPFVLGVLAALGISLFRLHTAPYWILGLAPSVPPGRWGAVLGVYVLGIVGSHVIVHVPVALMRELLAPATLPKQVAVISEAAAVRGSVAAFRFRDYLPPVLLGACETVLYSTAIAINKGEFISVWIGIKVAGTWSVWQREEHESRTRFQIFLIGNALCIMSAFVTARVLRFEMIP